MKRRQLLRVRSPKCIRGSIPTVSAQSAPRKVYVRLRIPVDAGRSVRRGLTAATVASFSIWKERSGEVVVLDRLDLRGEVTRVATG
jgi:hypothetical protein